jgi:hypothetical protein
VPARHRGHTFLAAEVEGILPAGVVRPAAAGLAMMVTARSSVPSSERSQLHPCPINRGEEGSAAPLSQCQVPRAAITPPVAGRQAGGGRRAPAPPSTACAHPSSSPAPAAAAAAAAVSSSSSSSSSGSAVACVDLPPGCIRTMGSQLSLSQCHSVPPSVWHARARTRTSLCQEPAICPSRLRYRSRQLWRASQRAAAGGSGGGGLRRRPTRP